MKKAIYTFRFLERPLIMLLVLTLLVLSPNIVNACAMSCTESQQVSLDENCEAVITPNLILSDDGASCPEGTVFSVAARRTMTGPNIAEGPTITLTGADVNSTLIIEVTSDDGVVVNRCWGNILLEDKLAPTVDCQDVTISCNDAAALTPSLLGTECGDFTVNLVGQTPDVNLCTDDFLKSFEQSFTATDEQGNTSPEPCSRLVTVERIDIDAVIFPANLRVTTDNALACDSNYLRLDPESIIPDPSFSGVPTLNGDDLFPTENFNCNTVVTYSDVVLPEVGCVTKVMRTFVISEWICGTDEITDSTQIIEIVDNEGPELAALNDVSISTSTGFDCEAAYLLPQINAVDNCKEVSRIDIAYPGGFIEDYDGFELIMLNRGENLITVTAYDACLNSSTESFTASVSDNNAPVAVCDQNTVVALSSNFNGLTTVQAISFDDGSYDECGLGNNAMSVKRMDDGAACGIDGDEFASSVQFCCADIGSNPQVVFRVTDLDGNSNTCMVNVELQDKLPAVINAPADMTVDCDTPFELSETGLIAAFGDAASVDNCGDNAAITRSFSDLRDDCNLGEIRRFFSNPDGSGTTGIQRIFFEDDDPFDVEEDIEWPSDVTINDCLPLAMGMQTEDLPAVSPDITGRPILGEDACDMVGIDYDDMVFEIFNSNTASCFKIIRTFNVGDWCQDTTVSYSQVIMITNDIAPTFALSTDSIAEFTFDDSCEDGEVALVMAASDDCTPASALSWRYSIDAFNDGTLDINSEIFQATEFDSLNNEEVAVINATDDYPIGTHRIIWTVEDRCGNLVSAEQIFSVASGKTPTPYCYNGLAIEIMGVDNDNDGEIDDAMIDIWASDFDAGSFHSCGYDVTVSFSPDPLDTGRTYTCDDLGQQPVEIWATVTLPDNSIVQDFCTSFINVQDNMNRCSALNDDDEDDEEDDEEGLLISGNISTEMNESIEEVEVRVMNMDMIPAMTNVEGNYSFSDMEKGGTYEMKPVLDIDHMNGVTTIDLVLIQRFILGLTDLDSPYKVIAADINNDGQVTAKDLLDLRKSILGLTEGFTANTSWKFLDEKYTFIDPTNPLVENYAEGYDVYDLKKNMEIDFVGIKIGDVNSTVVANKETTAKVRHTNTLTFNIEDQSVLKGTTIDIPVYSEDFDEIYAYQYTIELSDELEFIQIKPGALNVTAANLGLQHSDRGIITTSWDNYKGRSVDREEPLYYLSVKVVDNVNLLEAINFNSKITLAEAFSAEGPLDIKVTGREFTEDGVRFALHQNTPNPFQGTTLVKFELPRDERAILNIYDVTGKLIQSYAKDFVKGMNEMELRVEELGANGVLYYTLSTEEYTATRKMVVIK